MSDDDDRRERLFRAASFNNHQAIRELLDEMNADKAFELLNRLRDGADNTALHLVAMHGRVEAIGALFEGVTDTLGRDHRYALAQLANVWGRTALHEAAFSGQVEAIGALFQGVPNVGDHRFKLAAMDGYESDEGETCTALHLAAMARRNARQVVAAMLEGVRGVGPGKRDMRFELAKIRWKRELTALHLAVGKKDDACVAAMLEGVRNVGKDERDLRANLVELQDQRGYTALHKAVGKNLLGVAMRLLDASWSFELIGVRDESGKTALHLAVGKQWNLVELLLQRLSESKVEGAFRRALMVKDSQGKTALHLAVEADRYEMVQMLLDPDRSTWFNAVCDDGRGAIDTTDIYGRTALSLALHRRHRPIAQWLWKCGADVNLSETAASEGDLSNDEFYSKVHGSLSKVLQELLRTMDETKFLDRRLRRAFASAGVRIGPMVFYAAQKVRVAETVVGSAERPSGDKRPRTDGVEGRDKEVAVFCARYLEWLDTIKPKRLKVYRHWSFILDDLRRQVCAKIRERFGLDRDGVTSVCEPTELTRTIGSLLGLRL